MAAIPLTNAKSPAPTGFQAQLRGASLWDLVQMECLARRRRCVRVTTLGNIGYLFFDDGNVVHAATPDLVGEDAVFEMLEWDQGTFEPCDRDWPARPLITLSAQALMMRAAQAKDERERGNLVVFPTQERADDSRRAAVTTESQIMMKASTIDSNWNGNAFALAVRLSSDGTVLDSKGEADEFASVVAYACQLVEILGETMGMEGFASMECAFKHGRCVIQKEPDGSVLAVKPATDLDPPPRERLGL